MNIVVAGGHGQIARLTYPLLLERGDTVRGLIRNPDHADDLQQAGVEPVVCDLEAEDDLSEFVTGADAVVFAAGAGPNSGPDRKWTVDRDAAIKLIHAAQKSGIERYVMISAINAEQPRGSEVFQIYLQAKSEADAALRQSDLAYTIIRPGKLTDEAPTGQITLGPDVERAEIPRADVAAVLTEVLHTPETARCQFNIVTGETDIPEAVAEAPKTCKVETP